jgi:hypothetical protein
VYGHLIATLENGSAKQKNLYDGEIIAYITNKPLITLQQEHPPPPEVQIDFK